ncbi:MAG: signal peptidase II [Acidimicrobiales bacterium]
MPRKRLRFDVNFTVAVIALAVTALDALTKAWARHALATHAVHVVGALWLRLQYNSGISFSINHSGPLLTTIVTLVVALIVFAIGLQSAPGWSAAGFGLLLGGGIANVVDRLAAQPHEVTDFVAVGTLPVFNLADASITVGFVILLVTALRGERLLNP